MEKLDVKKLVRETYLDNVFSVVLELVILTVFYYLSTYTNPHADFFTFLLFNAFMITLIIFIIPFEVLGGCRRLVLEGKVEIEELDTGKVKNKINSPDFMVLFHFLVTGLVIAFIYYFLFSKLKSSVFTGLDGIPAVIVLLGVTLLFSCIMSFFNLRIHLKKHILHSAHIHTNKIKLQKKSFTGYLISNYLVLWIPLLLAVLLTFNHVAVANNHTITYPSLIPHALDEGVKTAVSSLFLCIWLWYSAKNQVIEDYYLGKIGKLKALSLFQLLLGFTLVSLFSFTFVFCLIAAIRNESIIHNHLFIESYHIILPLASAMAGLVFGLRWGLRKEGHK